MTDIAVQDLDAEQTDVSARYLLITHYSLLLTHYLPIVPRNNASTLTENLQHRQIGKI